MPRSLIIALFTLSVLLGCVAHPPAEVVKRPCPEIVEISTIQEWLGIQQEVAAMNPERAAIELAEKEGPTSARELYYFGLLHQKLLQYDSWTQARDTFRLLRENSDLSAEQQQLAGIFEDYNQNRINGYQKQFKLQQDYEALQQQLNNSEQEIFQLEQKIQALTDLEKAISTRREE